MIVEMLQEYLDLSSEQFQSLPENVTRDKFLSESRAAFVCGAAMMFQKLAAFSSKPRSKQELKGFVTSLNEEFQLLMQAEDPRNTETSN